MEDEDPSLLQTVTLERRLSALEQLWRETPKYVEDSPAVEPPPRTPIPTRPQTPRTSHSGRISRGRRGDSPAPEDTVLVKSRLNTPSPRPAGTVLPPIAGRGHGGLH
ncbi:hypothetical protein AGDE_14576 [Angomonas deanei]|nr:hypothetical protein AGDE_14576 [Angomonas deanei]|eukprot:EPY20613.1 hypothetical protein AGDE_14576 [Angomonas deanei]